MNNNDVLENWEKTVAEMACHSMAKSVLAMDVSDVVVSNALNERVSKLFADEKARLTSYKIRRRIAIFAIAALLAVLTACMIIPEVREQLYEIVITYHDKYFSYKSEPVDTTDSKALTTSEPTETTASREDPFAVINTSLDVFEKRLPTYLPEGYELYLDHSTSILTNIFYWNPNDGFMIAYDQSPIGSSDYKVNSEGVELTQISVNGHEGIAVVEVTDDGYETVLLWNDGKYDFFIDSILPPEEALKIAESIR